MLVSGIGALGLLAVAGSLDPDPRGLGTHQQLGLYPCSVRVMFGIRCPVCGMTTSWSNMMRGRVGAAVEANAAGALLAIAAAIFGVWAVVVGIRGRWRPPLTEKQLLLIVVILFGVTFTEWLLRLGIAGS